MSYPSRLVVVILPATLKRVYKFTASPEWYIRLHSPIASEVLSSLSWGITIVTKLPELTPLLGSGLFILVLFLLLDIIPFVHIHDLCDRCVLLL